MNFTIASTLDEALAAVAGGARPVAGGSDLVVGARQGKAPLPESLVAIDRIASTQADIEEAGDGRAHRRARHACHASTSTTDIAATGYTALADG